MSQREMDCAMCALHDAETLSIDRGFKLKDYWGDWKNDFASMKASTFEMVLEEFLTERLAFDYRMVRTIMDKRSL